VHLTLHDRTAPSLIPHEAFLDAALVWPTGLVVADRGGRSVPRALLAGEPGIGRLGLATPFAPMRTPTAPLALFVSVIIPRAALPTIRGRARALQQ